jgi:hypothetical protein
VLCGGTYTASDEEVTMRARASLFVLLLTAAAAGAADQTVLGRVMAVSDPLPSNPSKRKIKLTAYEGVTDNTIVGDPLAQGATLQVIVNGATSTSQTFTLPPGPPPVSVGPGWSAKVTPLYTTYVYKDKNGEASPVTGLKIRLRNGGYLRLGLKADAQGNNGPIDVVPGNPTTDLGIRLTLGTGDTYCVLFGGAAGGIVVDKPDGTLVKAGKPTAEGCPVPAP